MKRLLAPAALALLTLAAGAASAQEDGTAGAGPGGLPHARKGRGLARLGRCLSTLDLSSQQQTDISAMLSSGRATLRSSAAALKADRLRLRADIAGGAEKSVLGQDVLDVTASHKRLRGDALAVRAQIEAKLSPDQLATLGECAGPQSLGRWSTDTSR